MCLCVCVRVSVCLCVCRGMYIIEQLYPLPEKAFERRRCSEEPITHHPPADSLLPA